MKRVYYILCVLMMAMPFRAIGAPQVPENTFDVTITSPGKLTQHLRELDADVIEGLVLHGAINGEDLAYINKGTGMMGSLSYLNLRDVTFVYDGTQYAQIVDAPPAGMGTTYISTYFLSDTNYDERQPTGGPGTVSTFCYRNDLSAAFVKHPGLKHVVLPEFITAIGSSMFRECPALETVEHNGKIEKVGDIAFYVCPKFREFDMKGIKSVGNSAFAYSGLEGTVDLSSVEIFGDRSFQGVGKLKGVNFGRPIHIGESAFAWTAIEKIDLPSPPDSIPYEAFYSEYLKTVTIGEGLRYIGENAFGESVREMSLPGSVEEIGAGAISSYVLAKIEAEDNIKYIGKVAYKRVGNESSYTVKDGTVSIAPELFGIYNAGNIVEVNLPSSVRNIGARAFASSKIKKLPDMSGVVKIDDNAFAYCSEITKVVIPETLEYLGSSVFTGDNAIWSLEYNAIDAECADRVVDGSVEVIKVGPNVKRIPSGLFAGNNNITELTLPASVERIDGYAFSYCTGLKSINIPGHIVSLGESAFIGCSALENIAIDADMIPVCAFDGCKSLESVRLSDRTRVIESGAFAYCDKLSDIHWPLNLEEIGYGAFSSCTALEVVSLPEGLKRVENDVFRGCSSVKTVYLPSTVEFEGEGLSFLNDNMGATVTCMLATPPDIKDCYWSFHNRVTSAKVPAASLEAYKAHPDWAFLAGRITAVEELTPCVDNSSTSFGTGVGDDTDLNDAVVGSVYVTLGDADSYDPADGCIVLASTMDDDYVENIGGLVPGQSDLANRFDGLVVMVDAGEGVVTVNCQTFGGNRLNVKIGNDEPQVYEKNEKGDITVGYHVTTLTCIFIYGSCEQAAQVASRSDDGGCVRIYAVGVTVDGAGIADVVSDQLAPVSEYYTIGGSRISSPAQPGIYIVKHTDGTISKIIVK